MDCFVIDTVAVQNLFLHTKIGGIMWMSPSTGKAAMVMNIPCDCSVTAPQSMEVINSMLSCSTLLISTLSFLSLSHHGIYTYIISSNLCISSGPPRLVDTSVLLERKRTAREAKRLLQSIPESADDSKNCCFYSSPIFPRDFSDCRRRNRSTCQTCGYVCKEEHRFNHLEACLRHRR